MLSLIYQIRIMFNDTPFYFCVICFTCFIFFSYSIFRHLVLSYNKLLHIYFLHINSFIVRCHLIAIDMFSNVVSTNR